jgi:PleD family two-component response regulator
MRPILVLIANDQEWSARAVESVLAPSGYTILRAHTGQQALDQAHASRPDLIILDAQLPDIHGFEVCRMLRRDPAIGPAVPIIITTAGPAGRQQRIDAARAGAWEFFGQPLDVEMLLSRVEVFAQAIAELRSLSGAALVDSHTDLHTARGLQRRMEEFNAAAGRRPLTLACVVLRTVAGGDGLPVEVVAGVAKALRLAVRASDTIGQLGAGEFIILAPATDLAAAERLAGRMSEAVEHALGRGVRLSVGVAAVDDLARAGLGISELMGQAAANTELTSLTPELPRG